MITINVITLFPEVFEPFLQRLPFKRAIEKQKLHINFVQLRDFAFDDRGTVDGRPYGGGVGMLLRIEPVWAALENIYNISGNKSELKSIQNNPKNSIIALSPTGKTYNQKKAKKLTQKTNITLICGRYEGMDARIKEHLATEVISIGDYVLSGGEIPALAIMESITRLLPEVIEKEIATEVESFTKRLDRGEEFPQYTRPEEYRGLKVPEVLRSGNHAKIQEWKNRMLKKKVKSN